MSEIAVNSAQVWVKLQKRLGNNMSQFLSPEELQLLNDTIDAGGTMAEQAGFDPIGAAPEVTIDVGGPYEWETSTNLALVIDTPPLSVDIDITAGDQTPQITQRLAEAIEAADVNNLLSVKTQSGLNVTKSEIVLSRNNGQNTIVTSVTLT